MHQLCQTFQIFHSRKFDKITFLPPSLGMSEVLKKRMEAFTVFKLNKWKKEQAREHVLYKMTVCCATIFMFDNA